MINAKHGASADIAVSAEAKEVLDALTGTLTRRVVDVTGRVHERYALIMDRDADVADHRDRHVQTTAMTQIPGIMNIRIGYDHHTLRIDTLRFIEANNGRFSSLPLQAEDGSIISWVGKRYGDIVEIHSSERKFADARLVEDGKIRVFDELLSSDGRKIKTISRYVADGIIEVEEKTVTDRIQVLSGGSSTSWKMSGRKFFVRDTLTKNGTLPIAYRPERSEMPAVSLLTTDGEEVSDVRWFWWLPGGIGVIYTTVSQYERTGREVYLTGKVIDGKYEMSEPLKASDGSIIIESSWEKGLPFVSVRTPKGRVWARPNKLNADGVVETLQELSTDDERSIEQLFIPYDLTLRLASMGIWRVKISGDRDRCSQETYISWLGTGTIGKILRTRAGYIVENIKETNVDGVVELEFGRQRIPAFARIINGKLREFSREDSKIFRSLTNSPWIYKVDPKTGKIGEDPRRKRK